MHYALCTMRFLFACLILFLSCNTFAQPQFSVVEHEFESIAGSADSIIWEAFADKLHKFPHEFFVEGLGEVDSLEYGTANLVLFNSDKSRSLLVRPHSFGPRGLTISNFQVTVKTEMREGDSTFIVNYKLLYEHIADFTEFQIHFNLNDNTIKYCFGQSGFSNFEDYDLTCGLYLRDNSGGVDPWAVYLKNDPEAPHVVRVAAEWGYLNAFPPSTTSYLFSALTTGIGSEVLKSQFSWEQTNSGLRVSCGDRIISGKLLDMDGRVLEIGNNYGSRYLFFNTYQQYRGRPVILSVQDEEGNQAVFKFAN